ncbi:hypothetical protein NC651_028839 [Populus alba x Populus x berolinensis]|nr:hypothetical protein NC651_028839 [Populus alba x Populus x berolinensis]
MEALNIFDVSIIMKEYKLAAIGISLFFSPGLLDGNWYGITLSCGSLEHKIGGI